MKVRKEKFKPSNMCKSYTYLHKKIRLISLICNTYELNYSKNIDEEIDYDNVFIYFYVFILIIPFKQYSSKETKKIKISHIQEIKDFLNNWSQKI